ncbi:hypothetical protein LXL04_031646 [Taraxacum kok-saghyz]
MMVFGHASTGGGFLLAKLQVYPVDYEAGVSQRLLEASSCGDLKSVLDCIDDPYVDYHDVKTDVTALFVAVHTGNATLVRKLLAHAASAVLNFSENCTPDILTPYLDGIVSKLLVLLQNGKQMVQEGALTALASVADSSQEQFQKYYEAFMPYLKAILVNANDKANRMLRAKAKSIMCNKKSDNRKKMEEPHVPGTKSYVRLAHEEIYVKAHTRKVGKSVPDKVNQVMASLASDSTQTSSSSSDPTTVDPFYYSNDDYSRVKGPEKRGYIRCVGRMPAVKASSSSTDPTMGQMKNLLGFMGSIINNLAPNPELSAILKNMKMIRCKVK